MPQVTAAIREDIGYMALIHDPDPSSVTQRREQDSGLAAAARLGRILCDVLQ